MPPKKKTQTDYTDTVECKLPNDVLRIIFEHLDVESLLNSHLVCHQWLSVFKNEDSWLQWTYARYPNLIEFPFSFPLNNEITTCKHFYIRRLQRYRFNRLLVIVGMN